ncbi:MAG: tetratricopeptide repeat protein [Deltaproteobacteria bacterium]|nr:tetratricopeptide repeat protein [Deltaproteobacteria bacterium]
MKHPTHSLLGILLACFLLSIATEAAATPVNDLLVQVRKARKEARYKDGQLLIDQAYALAEPESREMAFVLRARAMNRIDQNHSKEAIPDLERSLAILQKLDGPESEAAASLTNDMAVAYYGIGKLKKAATWYGKALKMRETNLGREHIDVAQTLNNMAWCHRELGQPELAEVEFTRAIAIVRKQEPDGRALPSYLFGLGSLQERQGKLKEALPLLEEAAAKADIAFGKEHPEAKRYRQLLIQVQGQLHEAS